jgi:hypothetical protein
MTLLQACPNATRPGTAPLAAAIGVERVLLGMALRIDSPTMSLVLDGLILSRPLAPLDPFAVDEILVQFGHIEYPYSNPALARSLSSWLLP